MNIMRYLLEYTLEVLCYGNRSECARRLGLEYAELRKIRKRMSEGAGSIRLTEAILELYWRENQSLDKALLAYSKSYMGMDFENVEKRCCDLADSMGKSLAQAVERSQETYQLLKAANSFMEQMQKIYCEGVCCRQTQSSDNCPAQRFRDYVSWVIDDIEGISSTVKKSI